MTGRHDTFDMPSLRLDGRVALVTGGSRGLGFGVAQALAYAGADLALVSRSADELAQAARIIEGLERRVLTLAADVADAETPARLVRSVIDHFGRLDVLVHAAGINVRKPAEAFSREEWSRVMRINLEAAFFLSQAAAPVMRDQGGGRIVCVGSVSADAAIPNVSVYSISKSGLKQMVRALALEWAPHRITVNAIAPGRFWTAMTDAVFSNPELYQSAVKVIPLGRPGVAADLAGTALLLSTDAGAYVTGQTIIVDGGWLASAGVQG